MANSVQPQTSTVEDPPEPENVSSTAEKPPAKEEEKKKPAVPKVVEKKKEIRPIVYPKMRRMRRPAKNFPHPPYFQMISEALKALKERTGSSLYAITKHIEEKHKDHLPYDFRKTLAKRLKESVAKGKLVKIKASFKLGKTPTPAKKEKKATPAKKKATPAKKKAAQAKKKKKATPAKKKENATSAKKSKTVKSPTKKKSKTVKSPAKKKAKKVSA